MDDQEQQVHTELLVIRCQQGEKDAFESLVDQWQNPLLAFALRYLGNESDAWDVVQETRISVIKGGWLIRQSKLTILQEMKESELRILEMLKK